VALSPEDPLAHRVLESLFRAEAALRRSLFAALQQEGLSASGFSVLVVLVTAGGELELRAVRQRLRTSKTNVAEVISTLQARGLVSRKQLSSDRRATAIVLSDCGRDVVERLFPEHSGRVREVFSVLDEEEKRSLMSICRKLAA
jgi:MarR family transcriptional regulator, 2-MHQ and catechol-resistance regulon repressor